MFQDANGESLRGQTIRIITVDHEPFVDISIDDATGEKSYEGMCVELIKSLARNENFSISWVDSSDPEYNVRLLLPTPDTWTRFNLDERQLH